jgi:putative ABC transport system permease protein
MSATGKVVRSGVGRRRVQTFVVALATLMAVAAAVVAGSLIVASSAPFDAAFADQNGPHLTAQVDTAKANPAQLKAAGIPGVAATAGPFGLAVIAPKAPDDYPIPELTVAGRSAPGGALDRLTVTEGRWATRPGEIVLDASLPAEEFPPGTVLRLSGGPALTVVGQARSVSKSADAWVVPEAIAGLRPTGAPVSAEMLYRFSEAPTKARLADARTALAAALPRGALVGTQSYLDAKYSANRESATFVPFLMAFGALGLCMSVITVAGVVSGSVGASIRRIGILKAVGFTPGQVVRAYLGQALIPAAVGTVLGIVLGNLLALPILGDVQQVYGTNGLSVAWWVDVLVAVLTLGVVALAALIPALRAGRLRTVEAITIGRAPGNGRGRWAHRATGRLPLPRPISLGLATPFARPMRTASMLIAVIFGTVAATFAIGLATSLNAVGKARNPDSAAAVTVLPRMPGPNGPAPELTREGEARLRSIIEARPGTASVYGRTYAQVTVPGLVGTVEALLYQGDAKSGAFTMIAGHWITGPGQAVVPTHFLDATNHRIGDTITVIDEGTAVPLEIVGEAFDLGNDGLRVHADLASFAAVPGGTPVDTFSVALNPGTSARAYLADLNSVLIPMGAQAVPNNQSASSTIVIIDSMAALLTLMLVTVAGLGVLNAVVLDTRDRVRDLGICKAIGMSPGQTILMVLASVTGIGAAGGLVGLPIGVALHDKVMPLMGHGAGTRLTHEMISVYQASNLIPLGLGGIAIAILGALLPAGWAARTRTATALRTE